MKSSVLSQKPRRAVFVPCLDLNPTELEVGDGKCLGNFGVVVYKFSEIFARTGKLLMDQ